ncbi:hypothetical protein [Sporisorium scitamineum]|uniref:Uncharacterized protein n=1 Tax=Sporisorium scitamineum TaxID=49012 RepID=A0A0F7S8F0_9BASI|nr:hypothetical protein [Sporisorium scitamineum]
MSSGFYTQAICSSRGTTSSRPMAYTPLLIMRQSQ